MKERMHEPRPFRALVWSLALTSSFHFSSSSLPPGLIYSTEQPHPLQLPLGPNPSIHPPIHPSIDLLFNSYFIELRGAFDGNGYVLYINKWWWQEGRGRYRYFPSIPSSIKHNPIQFHKPTFPHWFFYRRFSFNIPIGNIHKIKHTPQNISCCSSHTHPHEHPCDTINTGSTA